VRHARLVLPGWVRPPRSKSGAAVGCIGQGCIAVESLHHCFLHRGTSRPAVLQWDALAPPIRRSTPDKPIHCIVWAKELHKLLIGNAEESVLYEPEDDESGTAGGAGASSSGSGVSSSESVYMRAVRHPSETTATSPDALAAWARGAFDAVFRLEIEKKLAMGDTYKTAKHSPTPLVLSECVAAAGGDSNGDRTVAASTSTLPSQRAPTVAEACAAFLGACTDAFSDAGRRQRAGTVEFDKDDTISMRLVASAANLRAHTFGIPMLSEFEIKSIAGNIVPAIATTNAVVAGLETLEAIKVLSGRDLATEASYTAVLTTGSSNGRTVSGDRPQPPSRACKECGRARVMLRLDTAAVTLGDLLRGPIKGAMRFREPNVLFTAAEGEAEGSHFSFLEDEDDPAMLGRPLDRLPAGGLGTGAIFAVDDFALDGARVEVVLAHVPAPDGTPAADAIELVGAFDAPAAAAAAAKTKADAAAALAAAASAPAAAEDDSDDDFEMEGDDGDEGAPDEDSEDDFQLVEEDDEAAAAGDSSSSGSRKRPREEDEDGAKRTKLTGSGPAGAPGP